MKLVAAFGKTSTEMDSGRIAARAGGLEEVGFDVVSTNDRVIGADPDRSDGVTMNTVHTEVHKPIVLLSMIAAVTQRLELITSILISPQRQTVLLAKQTAQLDLLSEGRCASGSASAGTGSSTSPSGRTSRPAADGWRSRSTCSGSCGVVTW